VRPATDQVTHRSNRRLFELKNLAALRDAVHPPYRSTDQLDDPADAMVLPPAPSSSRPMRESP
jgi:hypothetical protein